ncbi:MAG: peptidoglycan-binding domain-containing protein [Pseudomonadota bacterium]
MKRFCGVVSTVLYLAVPAFAGPEEDLFETAKIIYQSAESQPPDLRAMSYASVQQILHEIVADYPASDLALSIILKETIDGVDVAALEAAARDQADDSSDGSASLGETDEVGSGQSTPVATPDGDATPPPVVAAPSPTETLSDAPRSDNQNVTEVANINVLPAASQDTEKAMELDKKAIRDIQARLLVIGHNPNGIDGVAGKGTRTAIRAWQAVVGADQTGYLNGHQLAALTEQSQSALEEWLRSDDNAKLYEPPPVLEIGPRNLSGNWRYTTNCGSRSRLGRTKITGTLAMRHAGGRNYSGTLSNSQGLRGRVSATLSGRSVSAVTNFGLLIGKVKLKARIDDYSLVLRGRDSNGCSFYASK